MTVTVRITETGSKHTTTTRGIITIAIARTVRITEMGSKYTITIRGNMAIMSKPINARKTEIGSDLYTKTIRGEIIIIGIAITARITEIGSNLYTKTTRGKTTIGTDIIVRTTENGTLPLPEATL